MNPEVMNSFILLAIAAMNAVTAFISWRTHESSKRTEANVQTVEKATNSMKDALVAAAGKAGFQQGVDSMSAHKPTTVEERTKP
jgi:Flp pilus assembly protein TadB